MAISGEEILAEIRRFVASNYGKVPGRRAFGSATGIKERAWQGKYWVRWSDALREAGYSPNPLKQRIPEEEMLSRLAAFVTGLGHFPVLHEISMHAKTTPAFPAWDAIKRRYGGMPETAGVLLEFGRKTGNTHLAKLCEERLQRETARATPVAISRVKAEVRSSFVYLKYSPSVRLYKIGKADNPDKRGARISLLLPEDLVPRHQIKTDCPYILEKYWEYRFRAKKRQGEWYDLNSADIEAFKKRREFMFSEFFP